MRRLSLIALFIFLPVFTQADTIISDSISSDTTWSAAGGTYIVNNLVIEPGATLTIQPGVIIKLGNGNGVGGVTVEGNLIAEGTEDSPIYLTSIKDDSVGGDSNGDGSLTTPGRRNWNAMFLIGTTSKVKFDHVVISYSGYNFNGEYLPGIAAVIYNRGADLLIENSFIGHNSGTAIFQDAGTTTVTSTEFTDQDFGLIFRAGVAKISGSSLHGHLEAIWNQNGPQIDARNNWWGSPSGPYDGSTSTPTGTGDQIEGDVLYIPFLTSAPGTEPTIDPVIIIPGIMGSAYKNSELVIDPILHTYDDLIDTLVANGYTKNVDLFTFPYEWRDSNVLSANLLKDKINEVKNICDCSKVDLVAHSMGGLVAREYIQSGQYQHDVDQVIFLGTPHKGGVKDYLISEAGEFPNTLSDFLMKEFFAAEALEKGYVRIFDYINGRPISSVKELLPVLDYLKDKSTGIVRTYPNNYPANSFLESLNNNISNLLNSGVRINNIIGNSGSNTIEKIRVVPGNLGALWQHGKPDGWNSIIGDNGLERGIGDDTVIISSATLDNSITNQVVPDSHQRIPTASEAKVFNILTGKIATTTFDHGFQISPKVLLMQLLSPVDFVVTAPDGKKMGKNFSNGGEYNEIPGAFYTGYNTQKEYITILNPLDGEYKIELKGTGSGKYTVRTSLISDATSTTSQFSATTTPNQITDLKLTLNNAHPEAISVDPDVIVDINRAFANGWIKDKKTRDMLLAEAQVLVKFQKKIDTINKKKVERFERVIDKILARLILVQLEDLLKKKLITQDGYNLLKTDLNWLINH